MAFLRALLDLVATVLGLWRSERDRQAGVDSVIAERSSRAVETLERERQAYDFSYTRTTADLLDLNDGLRDRAKRD